MTHAFIIALLVTLARALLAAGCGELLQMLLAQIAPGMPRPMCITIGLVLGVIIIEIAASPWHWRSGERDSEN